MGTRISWRESIVFDVGYVRKGSITRVASAVGEGSLAISSVWRYVDRLRA